ncbi:MAG: hypothetical protein PHP63_07460, partial [Candidatus Marinimicrobia bacterium]|nr:hypothetical protein [Candidatus Neomarinimicrobiota bacterium]
GGFEPPVALLHYDDLANRCIQPLCHLSVAFEKAKKFKTLNPDFQYLFKGKRSSDPYLHTRLLRLFLIGNTAVFFVY